MVAQIAVLALSLLGLVLSALVTLVGAGIVRGEDPRLPRWCRFDEHGCAGVFRSPDAKLFWIPNAVLGLCYYGALIAITLVRDLLSDLAGFLVVLGAFTVVVGIYLTARLVLVHRVRCDVCLASHCVNLLLFVTFLAGL